METNKELLLKDLCSRLPYGVIVKDRNGVHKLTAGNTEFTDLLYNGKCNIRPYLFPLSSITEEQRSEITELLSDTQNTFPPYGRINTKGCDNVFISLVKQANVFINYCLTHHLDINGFIEKGLAIDATGLNIY